ncbi:hypothetical protein ABXJ76_16300 [Methylobacter sp. G7]
MPDGTLMDERRDSLIKGGLAAQAATAQNRRERFCARSARRVLGRDCPA